MKYLQFLVLITIGAVHLSFTPLLAAAPDCSAERLEALRGAATDRDWLFHLDCTATLAPDDVVEKEILIDGASGSGVTLDCRGAQLGATEKGGRPRATRRLVIRSKQDPQTGVWSVPHDVTVRNCVVAGTMRIDGFDNDTARESSQQSGHTLRAQMAAPDEVRLERNRFIGVVDRFKLLISIGATSVTVTDSVFEGSVLGTSIYVGDETADIRIENNRFDGVARRREQIALDGAADSLVRSNFFADTADGGIFIYRNCGERGRIRVQEPRRNRIEHNVFVAGDRVASSKPVVWIGSRNLRRSEQPEQCALDDGLGFGSSLPPGRALVEKDGARQTLVTGNRFVGVAPDRYVRDDDLENEVHNNIAVPSIPKEWRR